MPLNGDSLADLELLEFWHRHPLTADYSDGSRGFQYDFVRLGFSHHYLLNSILALAALQLFDQDRSRSRWYMRATAHQHAALTRAGPHLQQPEGGQQKALLGFAAFTTMYAVAEPTLRPARQDANDEPVVFDPVEELVRAIKLGRSATAFVQEKLASPPWSDSMVVKKFSPVRHEPVANPELRFPQLSSLQDLVEGHCESQHKQPCLHAIEALFTSIAFLMDNPGDTRQMGLIWGWGNDVDTVFLDMCSARHPVALVILAHYGVLMSLNAGLWHLRSWPATLLGHIETLLDEGWRGRLEWPAQMIPAATTPPSRIVSSFTVSDHSPMLD
jgi:hypothetical protein